MRPHIEIGFRVGKLVVVSPTAERKAGYVVWKCHCDCGNEVLLDTRCLQRGAVQDCGCSTIVKPGQRDITGMRSGKVVAIAPTDAKRRGVYLWKCRCDCGTEFLVESYKIVNHKVQSCGCSRKGHNMKDLSGQRFGKLTVLHRLDEKIGSSYAWLCQCDCGNTLKVSTNALLSTPGTRSCGCGRREAVLSTISKYGTVVDHCHFIDGTCIEKILPRKPQKNNTSGYTGVQVRGKRYIAVITFKRKVYYLGSYSKIEDAAQIRSQAEAHLFGAFLEWYYQKCPQLKSALQKNIHGVASEIQVDYETDH